MQHSNPAPHIMPSITATLLLLTCLFANAVQADSAPLLSEADKRMLSKAITEIDSTEKGPYTPNYCVCTDGSKHPVELPDGTLQNPCGQTRFCSGFRADWVAELTRHGMYIGNIFSADLYQWNDIPDHQNLVRGYILEKFYTDTHQNTKLAQLRAYGGLMGAEYEARDMPLFQQRLLSDPTFNDFQHFILAYELQKRFFVRNDEAGIQSIRNQASNIRHMDQKFKPLRDATHNQISAALIPRLEAYRDSLPGDRKKERQAITDLAAEIHALTSLDQSALQPQLARISDKNLRKRLQAMLPANNADVITVIDALAAMMVESRQAVASGKLKPADAAHLVSLNVTAAAVIQSRGSELLDQGGAKTVKQSLQLIKGLINGGYGVGLLSGRERLAAVENVDTLLGRNDWDRVEFLRRLKTIGRVIEWAHNSALAAFAEVWAPWVYLMPEVNHIGDDIVRGSPLLLLGETLAQLDDYATGQARIKHHVFGKDYDSGVRALNPGLATGILRVSPASGDYQRDQVLALEETPADLQPAAGIITRGEGNVVSHVQLLARALGIPNAVVGNQAFTAIAPHDGKQVFFIATPQGRVYLKEKSAMNAQDQAIFDEFNRNTARGNNGALGGGKAKLHVDPERLDIKTNRPIDLRNMRRSDSGVRCGPKAAFLGELKNMFPDHVARGIVVPFGAYYEHNRNARVMLPGSLRNAGIAREGKSLYEFEKQTYEQFFGDMVAAGTDEKTLSEWIQPRLEVIRYSLQNSPLSKELKAAIRDGLATNGLLSKKDRNRTVGVFLRSDTNVEDQDNFNGAGLNLTIFNLDSLDDIYAGLKEVWASPFTFRSFSWRQTVIDEPLWVLPSVVILESVPSEKSGVLVTADIDTGESGKMLIATSEGVGGAVDGTPAETLLWSPDEVVLQRVFRSPWRKMLKSGGGSEVVPSTGRDHVLEDAELKALVAAVKTIEKKLEPARDTNGKPRPWDIEYGFADGKLWLFQVRPFVGNEELKNIPALARLDSGTRQVGGKIALKDKLR
jgi:hypothetical protein